MPWIDPMTDLNMKDFEHRLVRINQMHAAGRSFEATDALGRADFDAARGRRRIAIPLRSIALVLAAVLLFKGAILAHLGAEGYQDKIAALAAGTLLEQVSAWVLHPDPATHQIAAVIKSVLN